jgi:mono/diheme cytochrome c family protein
MFRILGLALVLLTLAPAMAAAQSASAASSADPARGRLLVQRYCAGCHAIGRTGDSTNPAAPAFRDLHQRYKVDDLAEALAEGILVGHPAMPEMNFPPADVKAILAYLRSIQTDQQARADQAPYVGR